MAVVVIVNTVIFTDVVKKVKGQRSRFIYRHLYEHDQQRFTMRMLCSENVRAVEPSWRLRSFCSSPSKVSFVLRDAALDDLLFQLRNDLLFLNINY